ncbi:putative zinc finger protein [Orchesella cincta]|uniref:Putative zinc finger protein n=1 Tax=Orchesella cincta TaxID=48709 RepID=A0A1D2MCL9_ORCCI|nr:putative zinc finger protein [Orchesella cincta]
MFSTSQNRNRHARIHTERKATNVTFVEGIWTKQNMERHLRIHTGERSFKCIVCGRHLVQNNPCNVTFGSPPENDPSNAKAFPTHDIRKQHEQTHNPMHQCCICEKKFATKGYLLRHTRSHTLEKPFDCSICGSEFKAFHVAKTSPIATYWN